MGNLAKKGGGIIAKNLVLHLCEESSTIFEGNSALIMGGGACIYDGIVVVYGHIIFNNNVVKHYGGGIFIQSSNLNMFSTSNTILENNSALIYGGGIDASKSDLIFRETANLKIILQIWVDGLLQLIVL